MSNQQPQDLQELHSAIGEPPTEAEQQAAKASAELAKQYAPNQVPWLNDQYTYADRVEELELMRSLMAYRMNAINAELAQVRECCRTRTYPNIAFQAPEQG